jgi:hypothetical protein
MSTTQTQQKENVLLFGLGGIGGVYACILHLSGRCNVHVVARSNYEAVKSKGFRLVSPKFGDHDDIKFAGGELLRFSPSFLTGEGLRCRRLLLILSLEELR